MTRLRIAVVGAGHLGRYHARLLANHDDVEFVGVADPVAESREALAAECHTQAFADVRQLNGLIDAAIVAVPTPLHREVGLSLLRAGVHVLMEKPLALTTAEADDLVEAARQMAVVLQVGHVERFNPALTHALPHLAEPKYIDAARHTPYTFRGTDVGVVLDLMIHDLDVILSLVKSPLRSLSAIGLAVVGPHEDVAQVRLEFANGCVANVSASRVSYEPRRAMQVWSEQGCAAIDFANRANVLVQPCELIAQRAWDASRLSSDETNRLKEHFFDEVLPLTRHEAPQSNALLDEQRDFVESIRTGREPRVTCEAGRDALALAERIVRAIDEHAWDGTTDGRVGPLAEPRPSILRGPHWPLPAAAHTAPRREAG